MSQEYYFSWKQCASAFNAVTFYFLALLHNYYDTSPSAFWLTVKMHLKDNFCDLFDVFKAVWCSQLTFNIVLKYNIYSETILGVNCETSAFYSISHILSSLEKGILCFILYTQHYLLIDILSSRLVDSPLSSNKSYLNKSY